jgi:hypothetical protein
MRDGISRRTALGLGAGVLAGAMITGLKPSSGVTGTTTPVTPEALLAPLKVGSRFARWTVAAIPPIEHGALSVLIRAHDGHEFSLDVLARDSSPLAPRPPAEVGELAIYVCNSGDGWLPTAEEQGLAAMTLAQVLEANGKGEPVSGLLTHAERMARFGDSILSQQPRFAEVASAPSPAV